jgi:hypothetical protein
MYEAIDEDAERKADGFPMTRRIQNARRGGTSEVRCVTHEKLC